MPAKLNSTGSSAVEMFSVLVELGQGGIEGNGLAAAGRAGDQHHAEGLVDGFLEPFEGLGLVTELGHVELQVRLVEEPQHDLFAEQGRQAVDPVVHVLAAGELDLDAAVLGQAPLGDVHLRHDLEAGNDGGLAVSSAAS
jgi:hypothetical protein